MYAITAEWIMIENIANIFPETKLIIAKIRPIIANPLTRFRAKLCLVMIAPAIEKCIPTIIQSQIAPKVPKNPKPASSKNDAIINGMLMIT